MSSGKKVFIVGPGLIGWTVLDLLVSDGYRVTGLVRRQEHADGIKASGATPVLGDLNDRELIASHTFQHDIVLHTATADHLPSAEAVLDGVKQRAAQGLQTTYIHTSGTSVLDDGANGAFRSDKIFYDDKPEEIDALADDAPHRPIDLAILKVKKELGEKAKIAIMVPPLIYGTTHDRLTIQIPVLTRWALKHGYTPHIGDGKSVESNIHVKDLARAYHTLLTYMLSVPASDPSLTNPYYFCECTGSAEPSWHEVASAIAEGLTNAGRISDATPKTLPQELLSDAFGDWTGAVVGLNSRSRAVRLRALGWEPREKGWRESYLEDELPRILEEDPSTHKGYIVQP